MRLKAIIFASVSFVFDAFPVQLNPATSRFETRIHLRHARGAGKIGTLGDKHQQSQREAGLELPDFELPHHALGEHDILAEHEVLPNRGARAPSLPQLLEMLLSKFKQAAAAWQFSTSMQRSASMRGSSARHSKSGLHRSSNIVSGPTDFSKFQKEFEKLKKEKLGWAYNCPDSLWLQYREFNANSLWHGIAYAVEPSTAEVRQPAIEYDHHVISPSPDSEKFTTRTNICKDEIVVETIDFATSSADVDIDGTYSMHHSGGLALARLLLGGTSAADLVIEHSLAITDEERRRCLLCYKDTVLSDVLVLVEQKNTEGPVKIPAAVTMSDLVDTWRGDAVIRKFPKSLSTVRPKGPATSKPKKGFGTLDARKKKTSRKDKLPVRDPSEKDYDINCYKFALDYKILPRHLVNVNGLNMPDGDEILLRSLTVQHLGEDEAKKLSSNGGPILRHTSGHSTYESAPILARGEDDAYQDRLLMLPCGCHVMAPQKVPKHDLFNTEFGALLEPGDSYGFRSYQGTEPPAPDEKLDMKGTAYSHRLVRVARVYAKNFQLKTGTTSFGTTDAGPPEEGEEEDDDSSEVAVEDRTEQPVIKLEPNMSRQQRTQQESEKSVPQEAFSAFAALNK